MTIETDGDTCFVFKLKPDHKHAGSVSGGGFRLTTWNKSAIAKPLFVGKYDDCLNYIKQQGAEFMTNHGIPV